MLCLAPQAEIKRCKPHLISVERNEPGTETLLPPTLPKPQDYGHMDTLDEVCTWYSWARLDLGLGVPGVEVMSRSCLLDVVLSVYLVVAWVLLLLLVVFGIHGSSPEKLEAKSC